MSTLRLQEEQHEAVLACEGPSRGHINGSNTASAMSAGLALLNPKKGYDSG